LGDEDKDSDEPQVQTPKGPLSIQEAGQLIGQMDEAANAMHEELTANDKELKLAQIRADASIEVAKISAEARQDDTELKGMVQMMLAGMDSRAVLNASAATQGDAGGDGAETAPDALEGAASWRRPPAPGRVQEIMAGIAANLAGNTEATRALAATLGASKVIVRDENGRAIGVRSEMGQQ